MNRKKKMLTLGALMSMLLVVPGVVIAADNDQSPDLNSVLGPSTADTDNQTAQTPPEAVQDKSGSDEAGAKLPAQRDGGVAASGGQKIRNDAAASSSDIKKVAAVDKSQDAKKPKKVENRILSEIIVTAEKREESIQSVPISIQAFDASSLGARNIQTVQELGEVVPSMHLTQAAGYVLFYLRGIGTDEFVPSSDPSIATYVDGIYLPSGQSSAESLGNIKRVEVLKGPQGTLFGRDALGGAVNIITKTPGDQLEGDVKLQYARFDDRLAQANVNLPITSWLSASVSGLYHRVDSYYSSPRFRIPPGITREGRVKLYFHPTDDISLDLTAYHERTSDVNVDYGNNTEPSLLTQAIITAAAVPREKDNYTLQTDFPPFASNHQDIYYGTFKWRLPWFDFKLLGSIQQNITDSYAFDYDSTVVPIAVYNTFNEYQHLQSGEMQFVSNESTPWSDKLKWVFGLYYFHSLGGFDPAHLQGAPNSINAALGLLGLQPSSSSFISVINNAASTLLPNDLADRGVEVALSGLLGTYSYSAYTQATYHLTDQWDLTVGGRYQDERRFLVESKSTVLNPLTDNAANNGSIPLLTFSPESTTEFNFSPKAEVTYHPRDNAIIYLSYSVAYKSGTYNIVNLDVQPKYIVPEKVSAFELGSKVTFFGGNLQLDDALFYYKIRDLQTGLVSLFSGGAVQFNTVPSARSYGAELEGTLIPLPEWDPGLVLTANAAYVDATYTDYPEAEGFLPGSGIFSSTINATGNRIDNSPTFSGGIGFVQTIPVYSGSIEIGVNTYYNGGFYYDAVNTVFEPPYAITNARVSYEYAPFNLRLTVFGQNVLNRHYHVQQFQTDFGVSKTLAAPRVIGARLEWNF